MHLLQFIYLDFGGGIYLIDLFNWSLNYLFIIFPIILYMSFGNLNLVIFIKLNPMLILKMPLSLV